MSAEARESPDDTGARGWTRPNLALPEPLTTMSQTLRKPQVYRPGLWTRLREGLRYGGGIGQWSWFFHRITGLGVLLFLVIHIVDTFFVVAYPALYDHTVSIYSGMVTGISASIDGYYPLLRWGFRLGELGLIACVLFHSLNGLRIVLLDFWPRAVTYQRELLNIVLGVFLIVMLAVAVWVFIPLTQTPKHWKMPEAVSSPAVASTPADR